MEFSAGGSPPRMRGKVLLSPFAPVSHGITPAYAGKRFIIHICFLAVKDHPRVCGEKRFTDYGRKTKPGSPPRMRGKVNNVRFRQAHPRITPAYAGKRSRRNRVQAGTKDHPRVCGEKLGFPDRLAAFQGSPPRMRGKAPRYPRYHSTDGITPAYAGKSATLSQIP